mmetsp:Transcript_22856/g.65978  ORF Transcript_22856/g.65978 Transcript_22856/m.65978 type:complete len:215 (+) Transcript_22856:93-737(+)
MPAAPAIRRARRPSCPTIRSTRLSSRGWTKRFWPSGGWRMARTRSAPSTRACPCLRHPATATPAPQPARAELPLPGPLQALRPQPSAMLLAWGQAPRQRLQTGAVPPGTRLIVTSTTRVPGPGGVCCPCCALGMGQAPPAPSRSPSAGMNTVCGSWRRGRMRKVAWMPSTPRPSVRTPAGAGHSMRTSPPTSGCTRAGSAGRLPPALRPRSLDR